jgi:nucleotide-binding universal stress UspA family protein
MVDGTRAFFPSIKRGKGCVDYFIHNTPPALLFRGEGDIFSSSICEHSLTLLRLLAIQGGNSYNFVMYKKILAAVNEFTNSEIAARYAIALAKSCQARLSLVFVAEEKIGRDVFRHAESALERLFIEAEGQDIEVESITEKGDPLKKIKDIAREKNIDIVFTATRREDIEKRFFVKTLAREFMVKLPCSVAMVRVVRMGKIHPKNKGKMGSGLFIAI